MSRKKKRTLRKDVGSFIGAGVGLGIGTAVIARTGYGASVLPAFSTVGSMMRPVGTAMMGRIAIRNLKKIKY